MESPNLHENCFRCSWSVKYVTSITLPMSESSGLVVQGVTEYGSTSNKTSFHKEKKIGILLARCIFVNLPKHNIILPSSKTTHELKMANMLDENNPSTTLFSAKYHPLQRLHHMKEILLSV